MVEAEAGSGGLDRLREQSQHWRRTQEGETGASRSQGRFWGLCICIKGPKRGCFRNVEAPGFEGPGSRLWK